MTKVEQGILINSQHLYNVLNDIPEEISFKDQILELGYNNIEEFFEEKAVCEMQNALKGNLYSVSMPQLLPVLHNLIQNQQYGIVSIYTEETCVCHGTNDAKYLNEEYCLENNIPIYPYESFGGNIVATPGDYGVVFILPATIDISSKYILEQIAKMLSNYFEDIEIKDNDILIEGKKVVGSGNFGNENIFVMLIYFSMSDKGDLIANICGEPASHKLPGYINTEIISTEELREELLKWLQGL